MWTDSIVEEIHRYRENYLKKYQFDLHAICRDIREKQDHDDRPIVPPKPRPAKKITRTA